MAAERKDVITAIWRVFIAYFFYPIMIGLFLWLYFTGAHWIFGLAIIVAVLILDRTWFIIAKNIGRMLSGRHR